MNRCSTHSDQHAAWRCGQCNQQLCEQCAAAVPDATGKVEVVTCALCGGFGEQLLVYRRPTPYWQMWGSFARAMFSGAGAAQLAAVAVIVYLFSFFPLIGELIAAGVWVTYFYGVITHAAHGETTLPEPREFLHVGDLLGAVVRFAVATLIVWVPAIAYLFMSIDAATVLARPLSLLADPVLMLLLAFAVLYIPAALILAAISGSVWTIINPLAVLGIITRIPREYMITVGVTAGLFLADLLVVGLLLKPVFLATYVPILTPIVWLSIGLVTPLFIAFILGRLIWQNGDTLGYIRREKFLVPERPDARPRGTPPPPKTERREVGPIKYDYNAASPIVPQTLEPAATAVTDYTGRQEALRAEVEAGNQAQALADYDELIAAGGTPELEPRLALRLAAMLERDERYLDAAKICHITAEADLKGAFAPRAIYTAARLLADKVGNPQQAIVWARYLVENFPGDELAVRAQDLLDRLQTPR